jgi:hypothetical protein
MKEIQLTQGRVALVDDADYEYLSQWKWKAYKDRYTWYARRGIRVGFVIKTIHMHRLITNAPDGLFVDHINGDGLDNRRGNLRVCTKSENGFNRGKNSNNTTGYKGVTTNKGKYRAQIRIDGKMCGLGRYTDPVEAAKAYDRAAKKHYGEFAKLNFPEVQP